MSLLKLAVLFFVLLVAACQRERLKLPSKQVFGSNGFIFARGHWTPAQKGAFGIPVINSVEIDCDPRTRICREVRAQHNSDGTDTWLHVSTTEYEVQSWKQDEIRARATPRAYDVDLYINATAKVVDVTYRETSARGAELADPSRVSSFNLE